MGSHRKGLSLGLVLVVGSLWWIAVPAVAQQPGSAAPLAGGALQAPVLPASPAAAPVPPQPKIDSGDTAWMLTSAALVLMMTAPGLALFYGGMVRRHNVLGTIMQSFILMAVISIQWVLWGYSVAFGPDVHGIFGSFAWAGLRGVGLEPYADYAATIPHQAFMVYQLMFAIITPALITGAFAERIKFSGFLVFTLLWSTFIYDPLAHWVWGGGGWLRNLGALDFAGGTVVHISSGISALAAALVIGRRRGYGSEPMPPHNLPLTVTGAAMLWVGWFGFNAGQRPEFRRPGHQRIRRHPLGHSRSNAHLDADRMACPRQTYRPRRRFRRGGRPGSHHPGLGFRWTAPRHRDRRRGGHPLLQRLQSEVPLGLRRFVGRGRRARRRGDLGSPSHGPLCQQGRERSRSQRLIFWQSRPTLDAGHWRPRHLRLCVCW